MPGAIGVNLRVTGHSSQGGRKYMEDFFSVAYQQSEDECDLEFAFFGIFDGHGGAEAAAYAKEHLMRQIVNQKAFWSDNDADVLRAIREGYIATHKAMWREQEKWPRTSTGLPSTAGTTATVAFIRHGKMYIGHVGDSGIVLGYEDPTGSMDWKARPLTQDHKPECDVERSRIMSCGGKVVAKSGVSRVVWTRPRLGHKGPIRRSTPIDEIPFLAVARSLGDLWSYNSQRNEFVVSPDPDVHVISIDKSFRCLVFGTDGLWNVLSPNAAVDIVRNAEYVNDRNYYCSKELLNPSRSLVNRALEKWSTTRVRADNTSVVTILLDPPGGPKRKQFASNSFNRHQVGHAQHHQQQMGGHYDQDWHTMDEACLNSDRTIPPTTARNVGEELDLLNQSLYNHTHQFNSSLEMAAGHDFHLLASPSSSSTSHVNYENYVNLAASHQYHRGGGVAPAGGFLQAQLQGTSQIMQNMAMPFSDPYESTSAYSSAHGQLNQAAAQQSTAPLPTFSHLLEDTNSSAAAAASSYSLTRLETRMEQLTNSAAMYAHYQQLIESPSEYTPQVDLHTINTFHDYAAIPQHNPPDADHSDGGLLSDPNASSYGGANGSLMHQMETSEHQQMHSYAMDHEKFAWSQEWHQHPPQPLNSHTEQETVIGISPELPAGDCDDVEMPSSSNCGRDGDVLLAEVDEMPVEENDVPLSPTIQIHEITSSGVVPTPPPQAMLNSVHVPEEAEGDKESEHSRLPPDQQQQKATKQTDNHPPETLKGDDSDRTRQPVASHKAAKATVTPIENLRRRLRCQVSSSSSSASSASSSSVEKENKSQPSASATKRLRCLVVGVTSSATLAVTTRSTASPPCCVSTRKSAAAAAMVKSSNKLRNNSSTNVAAVKAALRSKQATTTVVGVKAKPASSAEKLLLKCNSATVAAGVTTKRNLLINSSKFNRQEQEVPDVIKKPEIATSSSSSSGSSSGIGRRLSKRDKVRNNKAAGTSSSSVSPWRSVVTKSTVQTRNRVQKRKVV